MATFLISGFSFQKSYVEKHKNGHNSVILPQLGSTEIQDNSSDYLHQTKGLEGISLGQSQYVNRGSVL